MNDISIIYCTAQKIPIHFANNVFRILSLSTKGKPMVIMSKKPEAESSIMNYYKDLLEGCKRATTPYVATCEDDTLYPEDHFDYHRPPLDTFAYNYNRWNMYTWSKPPFFSLRQRKIIATLIAPRELLIQALEDKFKADPKGEHIDWWGEPGRNQYERALGVPRNKSETFETYNPLVVFSHEDSFCYESNGKSKRASKIRALEIPYWGTAKEVYKLYKEEL